MKQQQKGFTIIELMFSTLVFSVVLLLCLTGLVQIGRMYYKGVTTTQTQQAARALIDDLTQSIQFSAGKITSPPNLGRRVDVSGNVATNAVGFFCIGATRYTFAIDRMQGPNNDNAKKMIKHAMWVDQPGQCAGATTIGAADLMADQPSATGQDMLAENMRLIRFVIEQPPGSTDGSTFMIKLTVAYGDDDLLVDDAQDPTRRYCQGPQIGTQFCAFSELSTIVKRRIL